MDRENDEDGEVRVQVDTVPTDADKDESGDEVDAFMEAFRKNRGPWYKRYLNKGSVSNGITFVIMVIGVVLVAIWPRVTPFQFILAFGLFGFSGGVTNSMAVKMLFDRVPGLYGSGVIERRFREIQDTVKKVIMDTFFDKKYLAKYLHTKAGQMAESFDVEEKLRELLESDTVDAIIDQKLDELAQRPEGLWLSMHGVTTKELRPMIKPFILGMGSDVAPMLLKNFDPDKLLNIDKIRTEVDTLLTTKLQELKPSTVKKLLEDVMRVHLGWLIVWGNVFGGCIGLMTKALEVVFEYTDATEFRF